MSLCDNTKKCSSIKSRRFDFTDTRPFKPDVRGSVHHSTIPTVTNQQDATVYQNFIIPYFK